MFRRGVIGALLALGMTATGAQAYQAGLYTSIAHDNRVLAEFVAAPWDRTDLTVRASDGGSTITFHDANGVAGKKPPPVQEPSPWIASPCTNLDQHTTRCHLAGAQLEVYTELTDAPSRYRDLAPAAGTPNPFETVLSGEGNDDIAILHGGSSSGVADNGGMNTLTVHGPSSWVTARDGIRNTINLRDGLSGGIAWCRVGPVGTEGQGLLLADSFADKVLADPGDRIDGCQYHLPV